MVSKKKLADFFDIISSEFDRSSIKFLNEAPGDRYKLINLSGSLEASKKRDELLDFEGPEGETFSKDEKTFSRRYPELGGKIKGLEALDDFFKNDMQEIDEEEEEPKYSQETKDILDRLKKLSKEGYSDLDLINLFDELKVEVEDSSGRKRLQLSDINVDYKNDDFSNISQKSHDIVLIHFFDDQTSAESGDKSVFFWAAYAKAGPEDFVIRGQKEKTDLAKLKSIKEKQMGIELIESRTFLYTDLMNFAKKFETPKGYEPLEDYLSSQIKYTTLGTTSETNPDKLLSLENLVYSNSSKRIYSFEYVQIKADFLRAVFEPIVSYRFYNQEIEAIARKNAMEVSDVERITNIMSRRKNIEELYNPLKLARFVITSGLAPGRTLKKDLRKLAEDFEKNSDFADIMIQKILNNPEEYSYYEPSEIYLDFNVLKNVAGSWGNRPISDLTDSEIFRIYIDNNPSLKGKNAEESVRNAIKHPEFRDTLKKEILSKKQEFGFYQDEIEEPEVQPEEKFEDYQDEDFDLSDFEDLDFEDLDFKDVAQKLRKHYESNNKRDLIDIISINLVNRLKPQSPLGALDKNKSLDEIIEDTDDIVCIGLELRFKNKNLVYTIDDFTNKRPLEIDEIADFIAEDFISKDSSLQPEIGIIKANLKSAIAIYLEDNIFNEVKNDINNSAVDNKSKYMTLLNSKIETIRKKVLENKISFNTLSDLLFESEKILVESEDKVNANFGPLYKSNLRNYMNTPVRWLKTNKEFRENIRQLLQEEILIKIRSDGKLFMSDATFAEFGFGASEKSPNAVRLNTLKKELESLSNKLMRNLKALENKTGPEKDQLRSITQDLYRETRNKEQEIDEHKEKMKSDRLKRSGGQKEVSFDMSRMMSSMAKVFSKEGVRDKFNDLLNNLNYYESKTERQASKLAKELGITVSSVPATMPDEILVNSLFNSLKMNIDEKVESILSLDYIHLRSKYGRPPNLIRAIKIWEKDYLENVTSPKIKNNMLLIDEISKKLTEESKSISVNANKFIKQNGEFIKDPPVDLVNKYMRLQEDILFEEQGLKYFSSYNQDNNMITFYRDYEDTQSRNKYKEDLKNLLVLMAVSCYPAYSDKDNERRPANMKAHAVPYEVNLNNLLPKNLNIEGSVDDMPDAEELADDFEGFGSKPEIDAKLIPKIEPTIEFKKNYIAIINKGIGGLAMLSFQLFLSDKKKREKSEEEDAIILGQEIASTKDVPLKKPAMLKKSKVSTRRTRKRKV